MNSPTDQGSGASAIEAIAAERQRQIEAEGWTPEHDDQHADDSLALVAALYASPKPLDIIRKGESGVSWHDPWPWQDAITYHRYGDGDPVVLVNNGDKREKHDRRKRLLIAGALIVAEIERLDRAASKADAHD